MQRAMKARLCRGLKLTCSDLLLLLSFFCRYFDSPVQLISSCEKEIIINIV